MSYNLSSRAGSSRSLGGPLQFPECSYGSFYPGNVMYSPGACQQGSPLYSGCQETCREPTSRRTSCYGPRPPMFCGPCQTNSPGSLGCGSTSLGTIGYGGTGVQSLGCGPNLCRPTHFPSRGYQSPCFRPDLSSRCFGPTY